MSLKLLLAFLVGIFCGLSYFWGLWLTVRRLARKKHPATALFSFVARLSLLALALLFLVPKSLFALLLFLLGFSSSRLLVQQKLSRLK